MKENIAHFDAVKLQNKKIVRNRLREEICIDISGMASLTRLSYPTVSTLLKELVESGEAVEVKETVCRGGRPAAQYALNPEYGYGMVITLERGILTYYIFNALLKEVEKNIIETDDSSYSTDELTRLIYSVQEKYTSLKTVILGIPGVASETMPDYISSFTNMSWKKIRDTLDKEKNIRLIVENDSNAMAVAEICGRESFAHITYVKKCIGVGIVINGELVRGHNGYAGEIYWLCSNGQGAGGGIKDAIKIVTAVLDPQKIYITSDEEYDMNRLVSELEKNFPKEIIPEIIAVSNEKEIYIKGLKTLLLQELNSVV